jgi:hypothetical protein
MIEQRLRVLIGIRSPGNYVEAIKWMVQIDEEDRLITNDLKKINIFKPSSRSSTLLELGAHGLNRSSSQQKLFCLYRKEVVQVPQGGSLYFTRAHVVFSELKRASVRTLMFQAKVVSKFGSLIEQDKGFPGFPFFNNKSILNHL